MKKRLWLSVLACLALAAGFVSPVLAEDGPLSGEAAQFSISPPPCGGSPNDWLEAAPNLTPVSSEGINPFSEPSTLGLRKTCRCSCGQQVCETSADCGGAFCSTAISCC